MPPRKDRHAEFALPKIEAVADLPKASAALLDAVAAAELTPTEAATGGMSPIRQNATSDSFNEIATVRIELRHTDP